MGFGKSNKGSKSSPKDKSEKQYRNVGTMWKSDKFDGHYISTNDYAGELIFKDNKTNQFLKVKQISLFEPKDGAPQNAVLNLVLDVNSEYQVEVLGSADDGDAGSSD